MTEGFQRQHGEGLGGDPAGRAATWSLEGRRLADGLLSAWERTDRAFGLIHPEALPRVSAPGGPPLLLLQGRLAARAWIELGRDALRLPSIHPRFDDLFGRDFGAVVIDPETWPDARAVADYRDQVLSALRSGLEEMEEAEPTARRSIAAAAQRVSDAEWFAQEDLLALLPRLDRAAWRKPGGLEEHRFDQAGTVREAPVPAGVVMRRDGASTHVPALRIDAVPVMNGQWLEFVEGGGYARAEAWSDPGWAWRVDGGREHPAGWVRDGEGSFVLPTLAGPVPLRRAFDWPVQVTRVEAEAYAAWRGRRLPSLDEWDRAAYGGLSRAARRYPWGQTEPTRHHGQFGSGRPGPAPVGSHPDGASEFRVLDLIGNGWEWTSSDAGGLALLAGASWASAAELVRKDVVRRLSPFEDAVATKFRLASAAL